MRSTTSSSFVATYQSGRFQTMTDTRHHGYIEPTYADGDSADSFGGDYYVGHFFAVDNAGYAVNQYFSQKDESPLKQQARALGKAFRDVLKRQDPLPEHKFSNSNFESNGRSRECNVYTGTAYPWGEQCDNPIEVAGKLLSQVANPKASHQAQEILVELSAMSLAAAGFNGFGKGEVLPGQLVFGETNGFHGLQLPMWKRLSVHKDLKPVRVARHLALLNAVKAQGVEQLKTSIDPSLPDDQYAEQLVHRGKMMIVCAPTAALHQNAELVNALATAVDMVEFKGLARAQMLHHQSRGEHYFNRSTVIPDALTKRSKEVSTLENRLNEAAEKLFPGQNLKGVPVK